MNQISTKDGFIEITGAMVTTFNRSTAYKNGESKCPLSVVEINDRQTEWKGRYRGKNGKIALPMREASGKTFTIKDKSFNFPNFTDKNEDGIIQILFDFRGDKEDVKFIAATVRNNAADAANFTKGVCEFHKGDNNSTISFSRSSFASKTEEQWINNFSKKYESIECFKRYMNNKYGSPIEDKNKKPNKDIGDMNKSAVISDEGDIGSEEKVCDIESASKLDGSVGLDGSETSDIPVKSNMINNNEIMITNKEDQSVDLSACREHIRSVAPVEKDDKEIDKLNGDVKRQSLLESPFYTDMLNELNKAASGLGDKDVEVKRTLNGISKRFKEIEQMDFGKNEESFIEE